jgi:tRNA-Thr(GGU) m(6)t(6)A37 methyltransferase TsaA
MATEVFEVQAIGRVASPLRSMADAPRQGDEGAPEAVIVLDDAFAVAARDLRPGDELIVLTWLHLADRDVVEVHPRGDVERPAQGVFTTRSPDRPNPIGLHEVTIVSIDGARIRVSGLEAIDGTPVLDIKPALGPVSER